MLSAGVMTGYGAWKLAGAACTLAGAAGTGLCICRERRLRAEQLSVLEKVFSQAAGEISYSRIPLPEIFAETGERLRETPDFGLGEVLLRIGKRLRDGSGADMGRVWREEMDAFLKKTKLSAAEKGLILSFPEAVWFLDGKRQEAAVLEYAARMHEAAGLVQKRRREEDKITMAFCLALSAMAAILLM